MQRFSITISVVCVLPAFATISGCAIFSAIPASLTLLTSWRPKFTLPSESIGDSFRSAIDSVFDSYVPPPAGKYLSGCRTVGESMWTSANCATRHNGHLQSKAVLRASCLACWVSPWLPAVSERKGWRDLIVTLSVELLCSLQSVRGIWHQRFYLN